jgi:hypothetical protein
MRSSAFERRMLFQHSGEHRSPPDAVITSFDRTSIVPSS